MTAPVSPWAPPEVSTRVGPVRLGVVEGVLIVFWLRWREMFGRYRNAAAVMCGLWVAFTFLAGVGIGGIGTEATSDMVGPDPVEMILFSATSAWLLWLFGPVFGLAGVDLDEQRLSPFPVPRPVLAMSRIVGVLLDVPALALAPALIGVCLGTAGVWGFAGGIGLTVSGVAGGAALAGASQRVKRVGAAAAATLVVAVAVTASRVGFAKVAPPPVWMLRKVLLEDQWWWSLLLVVLAAGTLMLAWRSGSPMPPRSLAVRSRRFPSSPAAAVLSGLWRSVFRSRSWRLAAFTPVIGVVLAKLSTTTEVSPVTLAALFVVSAAATGPLNVFSYVGAGVGSMVRLVRPWRLALLSAVVTFAATAVPTVVAWAAANVAATGVGPPLGEQVLVVVAMLLPVGALSAWWSWRHPEPVDHSSMRARPASFVPSIVFVVVASIVSLAVSAMPLAVVPLVSVLSTTLFLLCACRDARRLSGRLADVLAR